MNRYKHTQIGYLMLVVTFAVLVLFVCVYLTASAEPTSVDSGTNFVITALMVLILAFLALFSTLTVSVDETHVAIKFGYGIFRKRFLMSEIASIERVKNRWYYGWGIKVWFWPYMWIYSISGFDAVQIILKNGRIFRIGTDVPEALEKAIKQNMNS